MDKGCSSEDLEVQIGQHQGRRKMSEGVRKGEICAYEPQQNKPKNATVLGEVWFSRAIQKEGRHPHRETARGPRPLLKKKVLPAGEGRWGGKKLVLRSRATRNVREKRNRTHAPILRTLKRGGCRGSLLCGVE